MRKLTVLSVFFTIVSLAIAGSVMAQEEKPSLSPSPGVEEMVLEGTYVVTAETKSGFSSGSAEVKKTGETYHLLMTFSELELVGVCAQKDNILSVSFVNNEGMVGGLMVFEISATDQSLIGVWSQMGVEKTMSIELVRIGDPPPPFVGPPEPKKEEAPPSPPKKRVPVNIGVA